MIGDSTTTSPTFLGRICPACEEPCDRYEVSFSKEGTWCNHKGWVLKTGLTRDDPLILGGTPLSAPDESGSHHPLPKDTM